MEPFFLWLRAPFAAYRGFQAGGYRSTMPIVPPSAAWGLVLNLAGIETRDGQPALTTRIRADAPCMEIALGIANEPQTSTLYQQLHIYPVGNSGKEFKERCHGAKYWIQPARRELLVDLEMVIGVRSDGIDLRARIEHGLLGELEVDRYGLPFAGDNNLLFDTVNIVDELPPVRWYERVLTEDAPPGGTIRLTVGIDREDSSRTTQALFSPTTESSAMPPPEAWTWTPRLPTTS